MRFVALAALLVAGCAHREARRQTAAAYSDCLRRHPDGQECESLSRQVDAQEAAHRERVRAITSDDAPRTRHRTTCTPNGLGGLDCE